MARLSDEQFNKILNLFQERMQAINDEYLVAMGEHLKEIGQLIPSDVNRYAEMRRMRNNMAQAKRRIADVAGVGVKDIEKILRYCAQGNTEFMETVFGRNAQAKSTRHIERIINAQLSVTAQTFKNLSRTTIETHAYRNAIDVACSAVQGGVSDYNSAIRRVLRNAAKDGIQITEPLPAPTGSKEWRKAVRRNNQVQYASGYRRRLDTAVRQNVLDSVRSVNNAMLQALGEDFGADGIEISAHMLCAEDHLPYQGRQYSKKEFEGIQGSLARPFGLWNCKHTMHPIILGVSQPAYSDEELKRFEEYSTEEIEIEGKTMSRYEWSQEQRRTETAIRWQKDIQTAAKAAGDDALVRDAKFKENALKDYYSKISAGSELDERKDKMFVPGSEVTFGNGLTRDANGSIIGTGRAMANGNRASLRDLKPAEIAEIKQSILKIEADPAVFDFENGSITSYHDELDIITIKGDVYPDLGSSIARDRMSVEAVLAHEYYGHRAHRWTKLPRGDWRDEMRASMTAAISGKGLTDEDRQLLMQDAIDRMRAAGADYKITPQMRRILYGY